MPESNLWKKVGDFVWSPDSDASNAADNVLIRAHNLVPDTDGSLSLRSGSTRLVTGLADRIHSMHTLDMDAGTFTFLGAGDKVWKYDGSTTSDFGVTFDGSGDIAFGDDAYRVFMARGTTKKKFDGQTLHEWSIAAPPAAPSVAAVTAITTEVASFDSTESPAFTINEGTGAFVTGSDGTTANGALKLTPDSTTGRASASKKFASDQDFYDIKGGGSAETDVFDCYIWLEEPRKVDKITFMFGLGTGADPFKDDYYYFDFDIDQSETPLKDPAAQAVDAFKASNNIRTASLSLEQITKVRSADEARSIIKKIGGGAGPTARFRTDSAENSPAWTHLSLTRGQFKRVGGTSGRDWSTVRGFKVVYACSSPTSKVAQFDSAVWTGGGSRSFTGTYRVAYRYARNQTDDTGQTLYYELSGLSPISDPIVLNQQAIQITISAAAISAADPQCSQVWIYLYGGFLDTFYRAAVTTLSAGSPQVVDDFPADASAWDEQDRMQVISIGHGIPGFSPDTSLILTLNKPELEILIENEMLEPGAVGPPNNIVDIAGPWRGRMFCLTQNGELYVSSATSPSNFSQFHVIDLRRYGDPLWLVKTSGGITAGFTKDIIRIAGSGDESPDRLSIDLYGDPLNVGNPPMDAAHYTDGNSVIYRSADGVSILTGASVRTIPAGGTSLLWRGQTRHGMLPLNTATGRFRFISDNQLIYMLASEGSDTDPSAIWRLDPSKGEGGWSRLTHSSTFLCFARSASGALFAGSADGALWELDSGTLDNNAEIAVDLLTPIMDGGDPLRRKDPIDAQFHIDTGGSSGTVSFYKDGSATANASYAISSSSPSIFRINLLDLGSFIKLQIRISGDFSKFTINGMNVSYRARPQHTMAVDSGYIVGEGDLTWLSEVEIDANTPSDLSLLIYKDDTLWSTISIPVTANIRGVYRTTVPRGTKARRLRLVVQTTASDSAGQNGFECYSIRVRKRGSGNQSGAGFHTIWPVGGAD